MADKKKGDAEDEKKGMGAKLKPVMFLVAVVAAGAGYKFVLAPKPVTTPPADGEVAAAEVALEEGVIVTVPELVLNLAGPGQHFLRVGAALVLEKGVNADAFTKEIPFASDVLLDVLSEKTPEELREPGAKAELKAELSEKVREAYHGEKVIRVIFTAFVMQ